MAMAMQRMNTAIDTLLSKHQDACIAWSIALPVAAVIGLIAGVFQRLPSVATVLILSLLLFPSIFLTYFIKKKAFKDADDFNRHRTRSVIEKQQDKRLRMITTIARIFGVALLAVGFQIIRKTERIPYYVLGGILVLIGAIVAGGATGVAKVAAE